MKKYLFLLLLIPLLLFFTNEQDERNIKREIETALAEMNRYWNNGDLDKYMNYYANTDKVTMQSSDSRYYGFKTIRSLFVNTIPDKDRRGDLSFSEEEIHVLSKNSVYVIGKFILTFEDGRKREGYYTIVMKKLKEGWKIVHDQS